MSLAETPKHIANTIVAVAPAASYWSGFSLGVTILAGLVSVAWMGSLLWKLYFPEKFNAFVHRINRK